MNAPGVAAAALWLAGITLVVLSVLRGDATVSLIVIIPVVSGSSVTFVGGVGLIIAGLVALLFAFSAPWSSQEAPLRPHQRGVPSGEPEGGAGGFVLIGPVPIMFGSWRGISRRDRWWLGLIGATILIVVVLATLWLVR